MTRVAFDSTTHWKNGTVSNWSDTFSVEYGTSLEDIYEFIKRTIVNNDDEFHSIYDIASVDINLDLFEFKTTIR